MAAIEIVKTPLNSNSNLKAYYRYEESSGTTLNDSTSNGINGTASRTEIFSDGSGKFGRHGTFVRASSDKITFPDVAGLKPTGNFTFGTWLLTGTTGLIQGIFQSWSGNTNICGFQIFISAGNKITFQMGNNTGAVVNTNYKTIVGSTSVTNAVYRFIVCTWDGSNLNLYVDGSSDATAVAWANAPAYAATTYIRLGTTNSAGVDALYLDGRLDDSFLVHEALSSTVISGIYNGTYLSKRSNSIMMGI